MDTSIQRGRAASSSEIWGGTVTKETLGAAAEEFSCEDEAADEAADASEDAGDAEDADAAEDVDAAEEGVEGTEAELVSWTAFAVWSAEKAEERPVSRLSR